MTFKVLNAVILGLLRGARTWRGWLVLPGRYDESVYTKGDAVIVARHMAATRNGCWKREFAVYRRGADPEVDRPVGWYDTLTDAMSRFD